MGLSSFPSITGTSAEWLALHLKPDASVFEWGAGSSTIYFAEHAAQVVSVEHTAKWQGIVQAALVKKGLNGCTVKFIPPEAIPPEHHVDVKKARALACIPNSYRSAPFRNYSFEEYVKYIDTYPDDYFDFVFVDGRARSSCISHALCKIRPGGHLMLDDAGRGRYNKATALMKRWDHIAFHGPCGPSNHRRGKWTTTVWTKPVEGV